MDPFEKMRELIIEIEDQNPQSVAELDQFRQHYISIIKPLYGIMKDITPERRREFGLLLNEAKTRGRRKKMKEIVAGNDPSLFFSFVSPPETEYLWLIYTNYTLDNLHILNALIIFDQTFFIHN